MIGQPFTMTDVFSKEFISETLISFLPSNNVYHNEASKLLLMTYSYNFLTFYNIDITVILVLNINEPIIKKIKDLEKKIKSPNNQEVHIITFLEEGFSNKKDNIIYIKIDDFIKRSERNGVSKNNFHNLKLREFLDNIKYKKPNFMIGQLENLADFLSREFISKTLFSFLPSKIKYSKLLLTFHDNDFVTLYNKRVSIILVFNINETTLKKIKKRKDIIKFNNNQELYVISFLEVELSEQKDGIIYLKINDFIKLTVKNGISETNYNLYKLRQLLENKSSY